METIHNKILEKFEPVRLEEMDKVALLDRIDTKYILNTKNLKQLLEQLSGNYYLLEIDGKRCFNYNTLYYDTPLSDMFFTHIRGKLNRFKVRKRIYMETGTTYFEVKFKNNKQRTIKWRNKKIYGNNIENIEEIINDDFLSKNFPYNAVSLIPMLRNKFKRLTLVDEHFTHRVTIDYDLAFNHVNLSTLTKEYRVDRLAIIEIKTTRTFDKNGIHQALYNLNIHPNGFSKYCMGRYYTEPQIAKSNSLKPKLLTINKIISC